MFSIVFLICNALFPDLVQRNMITNYWVRTQIPSWATNLHVLFISTTSNLGHAWSQETWSPNTGYAHRFRPGLQIFMFFLFLPQAISETKSTSPGRKSLDGQKWWVRRGIGHGYCHPKNTYRTKCQLENWTEGMVVQARKENEGCIARFADSWEKSNWRDTRSMGTHSDPVVQCKKHIMFLLDY